MKKIIIITKIIALCIAAIGTAAAQNMASNTRVQPKSNLVIVYYDLAEKSDVEAYVSFDGVKWQGPMRNYSGSAGRGVESGKDKIIIWHSIEEIGSVERNASIRVIATRVGGTRSPDIVAFLESVTPGISVPVVEIPKEPEIVVIPEPEPPKTGSWVVIIGSFSTRALAENYANQQLQREGLECEIIDAGQQRFRVSAGRFDTAAQAINLSNRLKPARQGQVWVTTDD